MNFVNKTSEITWKGHFKKIPFDTHATATFPTPLICKTSIFQSQNPSKIQKKKTKQTFYVLDSTANLLQVGAKKFLRTSFSSLSDTEIRVTL